MRAHPLFTTVPDPGDILSDMAATKAPRLGRLLGRRDRGEPEPAVRISS
jgi:hypothetical protein